MVSLVDTKVIPLEVIENFLIVLTYAYAVSCDVAYLVLNDVFEESWNYELEYYNSLNEGKEVLSKTFVKNK